MADYLDPIVQPRHPPRIVLADDSPAVAEDLRQLLAADFHVVSVVGSGRDLINAAYNAEPDAIVTDISMPGINGLDAVRAILATHPSACVVFVTIHDEPSVIRRALSMGARGYVLKTEAGDELVPALRAVIAGTQYLSRSARSIQGRDVH